MADKKISELTALTGANVATDDQLVIVDTSAALTKSITIDEFKNALDTATGFVRITGDTMTGNLSMGDNVKAIFGAGSDLQIYHNTTGFTGNIIESATNNLYIRSNSLYFQKADGTENNMFAISDGAVSLAYDNAPKLATTSTGVDITGVLTSDGLSVNTGTTGTIAQFRGANTDLLNVDGDTDAITLDARNVSSLSFEIQGTKAMKIDNANDISFYEDTGTTAKFFWDASAESLGIGTSSPSAKLHSHVGASSTTGVLAENANDAASTGDLIKAYSARGNTSAYNLIKAENSIGVKFLVAGSGNVGIGTNSPASLVHLESDTPVITLRDTSAYSAGTGPYVQFQGLDSGSTNRVFGQIYGLSNGSNSGELAFYTRDSGSTAERMRIDSSGNVGIGTSPQSFAKLQVKTDTNKQIAMFSNTDGATIGGITDIGGSTTLRLAGAPLIMTGGGGSGSEAMRIDSSGNLLVGTTNGNVGNSSATNDGIFMGSGSVIAGRTSNLAAIFNRRSTDGDIVDFRKDGAPVGSISSVLNGSDRNLDIGSGDTRLLFYGPTTPAYVPRKASNSASDGYADLGLSSNRFKDLYLSGGVFLGGTGSANKLDDYEEGTWTPAWTSSGNTYGYSENAGLYTKVGRLVHVIGRIDVNSVSGSSGNSAQITGLPFTTNSTAACQGGMTPMQAQWGSATARLMIYIGNNRDYLAVYDNAFNSNYVTLKGDEIGSNDSIIFTLSYPTS